MKCFKILMPAFIFLISLFLSDQLQAQNVMLQKYKGHEDFTTVTISKKMFEMIAKFDFDDEEENQVNTELLRSIKGIDILVYENEDSLNNNGFSRTLYEEAGQELSTVNNFEELMTVKDGLDDVQFLIKEQADTIQQLLLLVGSEEEFVMITIEGNLDLNQLSKLSEAMDIKGMEHLDNLKQLENNE